MGVVIGELEVVAAPPPVEPGPGVSEPPPPLTVADVVRIDRRERARRARQEAD